MQKLMLLEYSTGRW